MAIEGFDDALSDEEEAKLRELSEAQAPPPISGEGEDADAPAAAAPAAAEPAAVAEPGAEPAAVTDVSAEADAEAKESFDQFAAKHKDRTPEELLKLAFQKEQARKSARFDAKQARDIVTDLRDGLQKRAAARTTKQVAERAQFNETLATDPDAAATMAFERQQERERQEAEAEDWQGYVAAQTEICNRAIPRFREVAPEMMQFGVEFLGYEPLQVQNAHDSRDMIALYMASRFHRLMQAGVVSFDGALVNPAAVVAEAAPAAAAPVLTRQAPRTLSAAPGGAGGGAKSLKDQAQDLLSMSDADFDKAVEQGAFDATLRSLAGDGR
jgi:hypothetical protein